MSATAGMSLPPPAQLMSTVAASAVRDAKLGQLSELVTSTMCTSSATGGWPSATWAGPFRTPTLPRPRVSDTFAADSVACDPEAPPASAIVGEPVTSSTSVTLAATALEPALSPEPESRAATGTASSASSRIKALNRSSCLCWYRGGLSQCSKG